MLKTRTGGKDVYGGGLNSVGDSVAEAKANLMSCLADARADYMVRGFVPYDVEFSYQYDQQSFFDYFSFLNVSEIAKRADINPSLMRQYVCGMKHAGEKTYMRMTECMKEIVTELNTAAFV